MVGAVCHVHDRRVGRQECAAPFPCGKDDRVTLSATSRLRLVVESTDGHLRRASAPTGNRDSAACRLSWIFHLPTDDCVGGFGQLDYLANANAYRVGGGDTSVRIGERVGTRRRIDNRKRATVFKTRHGRRGWRDRWRWRRRNGWRRDGANTTTDCEVAWWASAAVGAAVLSATTTGSERLERAHDWKVVGTHQAVSTVTAAIANVAVAILVDREAHTVLADHHSILSTCNGGSLRIGTGGCWIGRWRRGRG